MKYLILGTVLLLSGCYQAVNQYDLREAIEVCGTADNIVEIISAMSGHEKVLCYDSTNYTLLHEDK